MHFDQLGLSEQILKALNEKGYKTPTAIQLKAIPAILDNQDVMAAAQTGTGKTAGFTLPILDRLSHGEAVKPGCIRTLILTPTRELAAQILESIKTYGKHLSVTSSVVFGGVKIGPQMARIKKGVDILVATPGRLLDLYQQRGVNFSQVEVLVLDEADRMLDMGFIDDIKKIISALPKKRQNLMFSATFSSDIRTLAKGLMNKPVEISVTPANTTVNAIKQWLHPVDKKNKNKLLSHLIWEGKWEQVLVFARTKHGANRLAEFLVEDGMQAVAIHGNKSQGARTRALADFKSGEARVLVATDIAARGLDIELLPHVINFDLPQVPEDYIHRIGRTGRAGATGEAISLVSADEFRLLAEIERLIKQKLERREVDGFVPMNSLPDRAVDAVPRRATRTNQPKRNDSRYESRGRNDDRFEKARRSRRDNANYSEKPARVDRADMPRIQKEERFVRMAAKEWAPRGGRSSARDDRPARSAAARDDRAPRSDRSERPPRFDRDNRGNVAPRRDREDRPARFDRTEKKEWTPRADRPVRRASTNRDDRPGRTDRSERPARFERTEKKEWSPRGERGAAAPRRDREDRPTRSSAPRDDRSPSRDRSERPARFDRADRADRGNVAPRRDREDRPARFDRTEKKEWTPRADRSEKRSFSADRSARRDAPSRDDRFSKSDRPVRADRPVRSSEGRSERAPRSTGSARPSGSRSTTGPRKPSGPRRPSAR